MPPLAAAPAARRFGPPEAALLLTLALMWGLSFLFIEVALRALAPVWIVVGRTAFGAVVLLTLLAVRGQAPPGRLRLWGHLLLLGVLTNAVPWSTVAWAQQAVPSGLAALLMAAVPSSTLLVSAAAGMERLTLGRMAGLTLALAGVGLTILEDLGDPGRLLAITLIVAATVMYAVGAVYANRHVAGTTSPLVIATGQVLSAFVVTVPLALLLHGPPTLTAMDAVSWGAVAALGVFGTGLAFLVFYMLIERVGATNTTLVTYLIPVVAVIAGAVLLDERLGWLALIGGACIVSGVWLAQRGTTPTPVEQLEELQK